MSIYKKIIDSTSSASSNHYSRLSSQSTLNSLDTNINNYAHHQHTLTHLKQQPTMTTAHINRTQLLSNGANNNNQTNLKQSHINRNTDITKDSYNNHLIITNELRNFHSNNNNNNNFNGIFTSLSTNRTEQSSNDPVLTKWLKEMRLEADVECCAYLIHRTVAIDKCSLDALSIRNSHLIIQLMRTQSRKVLQLIDNLIDQLPLDLQDVESFAEQFSYVWRKIDQLSRHSTLIPSATSNDQIVVNMNINNNYHHQDAHKTQQTNQRTNTSPNTKNLVARPLDTTRRLCLQFAKLLQHYQEPQHNQSIHNANIESSLRKIKEIFGELIDICIRIECNEIVKALTITTTQPTIAARGGQHYCHYMNNATFNQRNNQQHAISTIQQLAPPSPVYSGSSGYGGYSCANCGRDLDYVVTNNQTTSATNEAPLLSAQQQNKCCCNEENIYQSKQYNSRYNIMRNCHIDHQADVDKQVNHHADHPNNLNPVQPFASAKTQLSLKWALIALWQLTKEDSYICRILVEKPFKVSNIRDNLSCLKEPSSLDYSTKNINKLEQPITTIERLLDIIVNQPNQHERLDLMNFVHAQAKNNKLIDLDEIDQSMDAAIYTSNQFKVAALVILNHLCVNEKAIKTILKCLSTPPPSHECPEPENRIIKSIFGDYHCSKSKRIPVVQKRPVFTTKRKRYDSDQAKFIDEGVENDYSDNCNYNIISEDEDRHLEGDDDGVDDPVIREAVRLLVQLTAPFIDDGKRHDYYSLIGSRSIELIIKHLTNIIKLCKRKDMILLAAATLAHISFVSIEPIVKHETNELLLKTIKSSKSILLDLNIRDQLVTILANTAAKYPLEVVSSGGLIFLLSSLQSCPFRMAKFSPRPSKRIQECDDTATSNNRNIALDNRARRRKPIACSELNDDADVLIHANCDQDHAGGSCVKNMDPNISSIFERIHQKAVVALARLSANKSAAHLIAKLGGIKRMIELCHDSEQRNNSDTVLKACIATLRVMAKAIGNTHPFEFYHALDLIELDFEKAFAIYKTPQSESQV